MRVLVIEPGPDFSVKDVHDGLCAGLAANGAEVRTLNLGDRLCFYSSAHVPVEGELVRAMDLDQAKWLAARWVEAETFRFWPDVVIFVSAFIIPTQILELFRHRPQHTVGWFTEAPYEDAEQLQMAGLFDTVIVNDPATIDAYRAVNPRTWYIPHGFNPSRHHPGRPVRSLMGDFGIVGTGFPERVKFLEAVDWSGLTVRLGGNWMSTAEDSPLRRFLVHDIDECMGNDVTASLYRSVKVSANLYRKDIVTEGSTADGWAMGPREVELAACGTFFLRTPRGEGDELFPMLPIFTEPDELGELARWWAAHDEQRIAAAAAARRAVSDRTFKHTTARLLQHVAA